ncbi:hypothetical protein Tco_1189319, partial [Tanacetum coccineum]
VMAAPTIPVFAKENLVDPIKIRVDVVHPALIAAVAYPAATVVRTLALHGKVISGVQERLLEMPTQRWEEIEDELDMASWHSKGEREACERIERQLGLIQEELESLRHSRLP